jgi:hypothetical protein
MFGMNHLPDGLPAKEKASRPDDDDFGMLHALFFHVNKSFL